MEVSFEDEDLERLVWDVTFDGGWPPAIVKAFRRRIQSIRAAKDERDLAAVRGNHFEKLKADHEGEYSVRLNDQYRLTMRFEEGQKGTVLVVLAIEDYH